MALPLFGTILIPFVFTLLVIVLVKAPKVGAALIGGLFFLGLAALFVGRMMAGHGGLGMPGFMEVVIVLPFAFVLLVLMFIKAPKVGIGVFVALLAVAAMFLFFVKSQRHTMYQEAVVTPSGDIQLMQPVLSEHRSGNWEPTIIEGPSSGAHAVVPNPPRSAPAPIWSEGLENEYEADVYPSRRSAVTALAARLEEWIQDVAEDANEPLKIVLFRDELASVLSQDQWGRSSMWRFERALEEALPEIPCSIEAGQRNINGDEIGITLRFEVTQSRSAPWESQDETLLDSGRAVARARHRERETTAIQGFMEKPWADDFTTFANERSDRQFIVARSQDACTSENEAKRQAEQDACVQVLNRLDRVGPAVPGQARPAVTPADIQAGGFIVDQFVQSFDGLSGRLWRQAVLIDASPEKLARLEGQQNAQMRAERLTWAGMLGSALGVVTIILIIYLFLNMATRGYYVWSLRVAGMVLAIAGIVSVILVLR